MQAHQSPPLSDTRDMYAQQVLEEFRLLREDIASLRANKYAERGQAIARRALSDRTLLVTESELPEYVPYTQSQIKRLRERGTLRYIPDLLGRKNRYMYNLRDVEATCLAGRPMVGPLVRELDWSSIRVAI